MLWTERACHETKEVNWKKSTSLLNSSLAMKDKELNFITVTLRGQKYVYLCPKHEFDGITHNYDKLLVAFNIYLKSTEESKSKVVVDTYNLCYLDVKE